jgi:peptidoglycan/LPS O-acetylase OafA/YrhL
MLSLAYFLREKRGFWMTSVLMISLCLVWRATVFLFIPTDMGRFFASTQLPGTLDAFAFGGIAAKLVSQEATNRFILQWKWPVFVLGIVATLGCFYFVSRHAGEYWSYGWTAILWRSALAASFATIIGACANMEYSRFLIYSGLPWLGKIGFSLYIYHLLPAYLVHKYCADFEWPLKLALASSTALVASWLSWRFIEIRFHPTSKPNFAPPPP